MSNTSTPKEVASSIGNEKKKAIEIAVSQIEKQFGKGSIMRLGSQEKVDIEVIPTGALSLDIALGGGIPKGRIIENMVLSLQVKLR
jgi:recombination protein RecA